MMAVGVAKPNAQGQATTSTATAATMATIQGLLDVALTWPIIAQPMKVKTAITSTTGTKMPEMVSARRCIGAFEPWACSTKRMIGGLEKPAFAERHGATQGGMEAAGAGGGE